MEESKQKNKTTKKVSATKVSTKKKPAKTQSAKTFEPKNIKILGFHDLELNTYLYENVENPKAVVIIVHGMQEHCLRYKNFAQFLNKNGFLVVTSDLRGHGKTAISKDKLGFGEKDIFNETLQDQLNIISFAKEKYNLPIYLLGHSYGSMLTQNLVQRTSLVEKAVISGTTNGSCFAMKLGHAVATLLTPFKTENSMGGFIEKMCIKSYGRGFERGNWLTKDEKIYDEYLSDEYCGGSFPFSFYKSLFKAMTKANSGINKIGNKKLMLIVGDKDPLSSGGKHVKKLFKIYLHNNVNTKLKIYENDRHELLNETDRDTIYQDIVNFYNE